MNAAAIISRIKRLEARNPSELMINAIDSQGREIVTSAMEVFDADGRLIDGVVGVGVKMRIVASGNNMRMLDRVLRYFERTAHEAHEVHEVE